MVTFLLCWPGPLIRAQTPGPEFIRLNGDAGLSHNSVYAITQDREGFLWFGTADGLDRYDGYEFVVYRHDPRDSTSLPNSQILDLAADRSGRLWVATPEGLSRYDPFRDRFEAFPLVSERNGAHAREVLCLLQSRSGALWAGSDAGLFRLDGAANRFTAVYPTVPSPEVEQRVQAMAEDPSGNLWLLVGQRLDWRLIRLDASGGLVRFVLVGEWGQYHYDDFGIDDRGRLWLSGEGPVTFDHARGVARIPAPPSPPSASWAAIRSADGTLWIGSGAGLYHVSPGDDRGTRLTLDPSRSGYIFNFVRSLFEDRDGTLWVGTHGGVYRADPHAKPFHHLAGNPSDPRALSSSAVASVAARGDGIWVGTLGGGLDRIDRRDGSIRRFTHAPGNPGTLPDDVIWSLLGARDGTLWVGTGCGLASLDPGGTSVHRQVLLNTIKGGCLLISALAEGNDGRLWLAGGDGLLRFDPRTGRTRAFRPPQLADSSRWALTESVLVADDTTIWIGMLPAELLRLDPRDGRFRRFPLLLSDGRRLESEAVWSLTRGDDGAIWLGTSSGLSRFDPSTGTFRHYFKRDGLPGSVVYGILDDPDGALWLGTNRGLSRVDLRADGPRFRNYPMAAGTGNTEFNRNAVFRGDDGTMYFGGLSGLTWFRPEAIVENPDVPPVVLTGIETASRSGTQYHNPRGLQRLNLSYRDYSLEFEVAALSYTNPSQNRYAYRLDGFDPDWVEAGTRRFVRYTDLPPGSYVLRIRGANNDGVWNESGIALPIVISPPFWQTTLFRAAVVLVLLGLAWLLYRARVARLLKIERLRLRIAGDLHDDLSSNLVGIALAGERLQEAEGVGPVERQQLSRITTTARGMVQDLRDIVWLVDPARDQAEDLVLRMQELASAFLIGIDWELRVDAPRLTGRVELLFRRQLYLIFKELLHNIVRHAGASSASVELLEDGDDLVLRVSDDGKGFDSEAETAGFGLRSIRRRAAELGGEVQLSVEPGRGTSIGVRVPIP